MHGADGHCLPVHGKQGDQLIFHQLRIGSWIYRKNSVGRIPQEGGKPQGGDEARGAKRPRFSQRPIPQLIHQHGDERTDDHGKQQRRDKRQMPRRREKIARISAQHIYLAVCPVHNANNSKYRRPANGDQRINAALGQTINYLLYKYHTHPPALFRFFEAFFLYPEIKKEPRGGVPLQLPCWYIHPHMPRMNASCISLLRFNVLYTHLFSLSTLLFTAIFHASFG